MHSVTFEIIVSSDQSSFGKSRLLDSRSLQLEDNWLPMEINADILATENNQREDCSHSTF